MRTMKTNIRKALGGVGFDFLDCPEMTYRKLSLPGHRETIADGYYCSSPGNDEIKLVVYV